jgi:hypothetical protein
MITVRASISPDPRRPAAARTRDLRGPLLQDLEGVLRDHQRSGADHVRDPDRGRVDDVDSLDVAKAAHRTGLLGLQNDQGRAPGTPLRQRLGGLLGRRLVEARRIEQGDAVALGMDRERRAQRTAAGLAVDLDGVAARLGTECDAAAGAGRRAEGADACAAGALLPPCLGGRHRDLAAAQG